MLRTLVLQQKGNDDVTPPSHTHNPLPRPAPRAMQQSPPPILLPPPPAPPPARTLINLLGYPLRLRGRAEVPPHPASFSFSAYPRVGGRIATPRNTSILPRAFPEADATACDLVVNTLRPYGEQAYIRWEHAIIALLMLRENRAGEYDIVIPACLINSIKNDQSIVRTSEEKDWVRKNFKQGRTEAKFWFYDPMQEGLIFCASLYLTGHTSGTWTNKTVLKGSNLLLYYAAAAADHGLGPWLGAREPGWGTRPEVIRTRQELIRITEEGIQEARRYQQMRQLTGGNSRRNLLSAFEASESGDWED